MDRLILHVGTHKTGTTALQQFFWMNRERLRARGVLYPEGFGTHHATLAAAVGQGNPGPLQGVLESREAAKAPTVLISSENFWRQAEKLAFVRERARQVTIVLYLRRQDHYVQSMYQENVKNPEKLGTKTFAEYYADFCRHDAKRIGRPLDWRLLVEGWVAAFGRENVVVRPYERGQFAGGSIFTDFLAAVGIPWDEGFELPPRDKENVGFSPEVVELIRLGNRGRTREEQVSLVATLAAALAAAPEERTGPKYNYLSPAERIALLTKAEEGNAWIARELLGRADGRLFLEPWPQPDEPWQPYHFDFRTVLPALVHLIAAQRQHTEQLEGLLAQAKGRMDALEGASRLSQAVEASRVRGVRSPAAMLRQWRDVKLVAASGLVDAAYYRQTYPDVASTGADPVEHYVTHGWMEGRNPSADFDTLRYLAEHPDALTAGRCPLVALAKQVGRHGG